MFLARDRNHFSRELQNLARPAAKPAAAAVVDDKHSRMADTNSVLEKTIGPMFETYVAMVEKAGRSAACKILAGSTDSYPTRAAVAEFWLDLTEVPGVAQYFIRFESEGDDWRVMSRPSLARKAKKHESSEMMLAGGKQAAENLEGALQQFIRAVF